MHLDQSFTLLTPNIATGHPVPAGWQSIVDQPLLILVGVTGVGKSTTVDALRALSAAKPEQALTLLPNRRELTDKLLIPHLQRQDGVPLKPVSDRQLRFDYTRRYRKLFPGGMAHALSQLWVEPTELWASYSRRLLLFDGLRGVNEATAAVQCLPNARFLVLDAPDVVRVHRLLGREDAFDQIARSPHRRSGNGENRDAEPANFMTLGLDTTSATEARAIFSQEDEQELLNLIRAGNVTPADLCAKLQIVISERRNYDPKATIVALQTTAPERTLVCDTTVYRPEEMATIIGEWGFN